MTSLSDLLVFAGYGFACLGLVSVKQADLKAILISAFSLLLSLFVDWQIPRRAIWRPVLKIHLNL